MFEGHWRYLGLLLVINGTKKYFVLTCLPFGLNNAARALTKLLWFPLQSWREWGVRPFIHLNECIGEVQGEKEAQDLANRLKSILHDFGLLTSDQKCTWR